MNKGLIPTKPIEKVFIHVEGDPSVGIPHGEFTMEMFFDPSTIDQPESYLQELKLKIEDIYREMNGGDKTSVLFDYEVEWIQSRIPQEKP